VTRPPPASGRWPTPSQASFLAIGHWSLPGASSRPRSPGQISDFEFRISDFLPTPPLHARRVHHKNLFNIDAPLWCRRPACRGWWGICSGGARRQFPISPQRYGDTDTHRVDILSSSLCHSVASVTLWFFGCTGSREAGRSMRPRRLASSRKISHDAREGGRVIGRGHGDGFYPE